MAEALIALLGIGLGLVLATAIAIASNVSFGCAGHRWLRILAPPTELVVLPSLQRNVVSLRALLVVTLFWLILAPTSVGDPVPTHDQSASDRAFVRWFARLRRLCGLPPRAPQPVHPIERARAD